MNKKTHVTAFALGFAALVMTALALPTLLITSCTKTLDGEINENQRPIVYFVNIPPEGAKFSRNPVVYWVGTDPDGVLSYFRYHVATEELIGIAGPDHDQLMQYIAGVSDADWTYLDIPPTGPEPQTSNVIKMSASLESPVKTFVNQYVFLQGVDEKGLASDIVVRRFSRNDNPPDTEIRSAQLLRPAINSVSGGGIITGVQLRFRGDDPIDYPDADNRPPFEYQWRLYGPYTDEEKAVINSEFVRPVCVTADAELFHVGEEIERIEISYDSIGQVDTTRYVVICDPNANLTDTTTDWPSMRWYVEFDTVVMVDEFPDSLIRIGDISYAGSDTIFNTSCGMGARNYRCEALQNPDLWFGDTLSETWVVAPREPMDDTVYNVFWDYPSDTTLQLDFLFWVRARDDAQVPDLTPDFEYVSVINPRYERDVAVVDFMPATPGRPYYKESDTFRIRGYWKNMVESWAQSKGYDIEFDTTRVSGSNSNSSDYFNSRWKPWGIAELLKHKLLILYKEEVAGTLPRDDLELCFMAVDAGINVWATWLGPYRTLGANQWPDSAITPPSAFLFYFAVEGSASRAWYTGALNTIATKRHPLYPNSSYFRGFHQDFVGGLPRFGDGGGWPYLPLDTVNLYERYDWGAGRLNFWENTNILTGDSVGVKFNKALPEVGWSQVRRGAETLYKYKSLYGQSHPLGFRYVFQGSPVALRYQTSLFKTAYFNFTPLAINDDSMLIVADSILSWLYDPAIGTVEGEVRENRYPDAPVKVSIDEARENARERQEILLEMFRKQRQEADRMPR